MSAKDDTPGPILFLTAGFGEGHNTAARNLRSAFQLEGQDAGRERPLEIVDIFHDAHPIANAFLKYAYKWGIVHLPKVWNLIYQAADTTNFDQRDRAIDLSRKLGRELAATIESRRPAALVSSYPFYGYLMEKLYHSRAYYPCPLFTVVTDSITINSVWAGAYSDRFFVTDSQSAEMLANLGVERGRIEASGFPVSPSFVGSRSEKLQPTIQRSRDSPWNLLYFASAPKAHVRRTLQAIFRTKNSDRIQLTLVLGKREKELRRTVERVAAAWPSRVTIVGWTDRVPELLVTHDLVIGKAGGASVHEASAAACPMLVNFVVPGQEEGNCQLLRQRGVGREVPTPEDMTDILDRILADNGAELGRMRSHFQNFGDPDAARVIARSVLAKID